MKCSLDWKIYLTNSRHEESHCFIEPCIADNSTGSVLSDIMTELQLDVGTLRLKQKTFIEKNGLAYYNKYCVEGCVREGHTQLHTHGKCTE